MRPIGTLVTTQRILMMSGQKRLLSKNIVNAFGASGDSACDPCCEQDDALKDAGKASGPSHDKYCNEREAWGNYTREERERDGCCKEAGSDGSTQCFTDCNGGGGGDGDGDGDGEGDGDGDNDGPGGGGGGGGGGGPSGPGPSGPGPSGPGDTGDTGDTGQGGGPLSPNEEQELQDLVDKVMDGEQLTQEEVDRLNELKDRINEQGVTGGGGGPSLPSELPFDQDTGPNFTGAGYDYECCELDWYGRPQYTYSRLPCENNCKGPTPVPQYCKAAFVQCDLFPDDPCCGGQGEWWDEYFGDKPVSEGTSTTPSTSGGGFADAWAGGTKTPPLTGTLTDSKTNITLPTAPAGGGVSTIGGSLPGSDIIQKLGGTIGPDGKITFPSAGGLASTLTSPGATQAATAARNILPFLGLALLLFRR